MNDLSPYQYFFTIHKPQLISSGVPELYWPVLFKKLSEQIFDAGDAFSLLLVDYDDEIRANEDPIWTVQVTQTGGIKKAEPNNIYLIDHAWSFRTPTCKLQLREMPTLLNRMSVMMGIDTEKSTEEKIDGVLDQIWKYAQNYAIGGDYTSVENRLPVWYIMDELGSGIEHNDDPNFRIIPFVYVPDQMTYSLLFPVKDCDKNDFVTRDYLEGIPKGSQERKALLLPWISTDFTETNYVQTEPDEIYFLSGHIEETLPNIDTNPQISLPLKVYSEYPLINEHLTDSNFIICPEESQADILWLTRHFKDFSELSETMPNKFVNQFPFEYILTVKDLLSIICRRNAPQPDPATLETHPPWLPTTYNLKTELVKFVSYFQHRQNKGLDNHWICKPWNLARGLDMQITNNLSHIMRLPLTGPKIAQKYIDNPVLYTRPDIEGAVKFDIRYVILLKSVKPLDAYIYTNFFLRFANKPFELHDFDDYEKHFTVMNYSENATLCRLLCADFKTEFDKQYPNHPYSTIENAIAEMLRAVLENAISKGPPVGLGLSPQSRALYAADIMIEWNSNTEMQPKLLEINWTPDCQRACDYYPDFYNHIFKLLFLNDYNTDIFRKL